MRNRATRYPIICVTRRSRIVAMISVVMGLFAVMTAEVWLWAGLYRLLDIFACR